MAFDPYRGSGIWMTLLILILLPFALIEFPQAAFSCIVSIIFLLESMFISVTTFVSNYAAQALLDRALIQIVIFFPLATLGGLGLAGLVRILDRVDFLQGPHYRWVQWTILILVYGALFLNLAHYQFTPSCCQLFSEDDQGAINWMDKNLPANASIVIASSEAVLFESSPTQWYTGSDGGIWIAPLIHRAVLPLPYETNFDLGSVHEELCQHGAGYIYVGGTNQSFHESQITSASGWYTEVTSQTGVGVFRIMGCPSSE